MSEMKYRIHSVSSQHKNYPAGNLVINQDGWQSGINCAFPQGITIQFYVPIRTKKLHILFHQYKLPKLMEVFVKMGTHSNYRKLGHISPNDNSQSSFEEKQQKTLYFQFSCTHIRFVIHENYKNDMNIFNQVALEDLIVIGEVLTHKEMVGIDLGESSEDEIAESIEVNHDQRTLERVEKKSPGSERQIRPIDSTSLLFKEIYDKLEKQKREAVNQEEYQKASHLKIILSNFQSLEKEISKLQHQKSEAIKNEDYDRCYRIKNQISKKKQMVNFQREELFKNQQEFYSHNVYSRVVEKQVSPMNQSKKKDLSNTPKNKPPQFTSPQPEPQSPNKTSNIPHDDMILPIRNKSQYNLPLETHQKRSQPIQTTPAQKFQSQHEIEHAIQMTERQADTSIANQSIRIELTPLENKMRMRVQNYFGFLPEKLWQLCQNKNWKGKLQVLRVLKDKVNEIQTKEQFMGTLQILSRIIVSKQAVVSIETLQLLSKLTQIPLRFTLQHLPFFVEDMILELLNFLNDTNSKIKELAYMTYLHLPQISFLNLSIVIRELIKHKNKVKNDPKLLIIKLQLMTLFIETYKETEYNFKEIMSWVSGFLEDPNQKVRTTAGDLLVAIAYLVGTERIVKAIEDIKRPDLLEVVYHLMNASVDLSKANVQLSKLSLDNSKLQQDFYGSQIQGRSNGQNQKIPQGQAASNLGARKDKMQSSGSRRESDNANFQLSYSQQSMYEESIQQSNFNKLGNLEQGEIRVLQGYEQEQGQQIDNICTYCGHEFLNQKHHYISQCKVLAHCQKCNCLVYIRQFTAHLLQHCQYSSQFRVCKKCGLAFQLGQINEHIGKDTCKKKLGINWQRCQFCCSDVMGEDQFWTTHSLECRAMPDRRDYQPNNQSSIQEDQEQ